MTRFERRLAVGCLNERSFAEVGSISCSLAIKRGAEPHYRQFCSLPMARPRKLPRDAPRDKSGERASGYQVPGRSVASESPRTRSGLSLPLEINVRTRPFRYLSPKDPLAESQRFLAFSLAIFEYAKFSPAKRKVRRCDNRSYFLLALSLSLSLFHSVANC